MNNPNRIRLIALDLDGTLLDGRKRLPPENLLALERAHREGILVVPATGRFFRGMPDHILALPFLRYAITINGAEVWDVQEQRSIFRAELSWALAVAIMEYLDPLPVIYDCYQGGWGWMTQAHYDRAEEYAVSRFSLGMIQRLRTPVPELKAHLREKGVGVQKVQVFFRDQALRTRVLEELPARFPALSVTTSISNNIEINSREATKGNALLGLAAALGLDPDQTMAFGDGLNDLSMLRAAGIGVAMGNAEDQLKEAADWVTADCDHQGVAKALGRLLWNEPSETV